MDIKKETIASLHDKLVNKDVTAEELANDAINKINANEKKLNTFITVNDKAPEAAKKIDEDGIKGPLSGIPIAFKDNIVTNGIKTTAASKILYNFMPVYSATVLEKLEAAGAVDIGKTNLDEFAMGSSTETSYFDTTVNPWDLSRVPGGSSGGSAAAVAAGEVVAALGTDTGVQSDNLLPLMVFLVSNQLMVVFHVGVLSPLLQVWIKSVYFQNALKTQQLFFQQWLVMMIMIQQVLKNQFPIIVQT